MHAIQASESLVLLVFLALILSGCFVNKLNGAMKRMEIMLRFYMLLCWAMNDQL